MWRKSSYSDSGGCVEVDDWKKSSYSIGNGQCLEWRKSSYSTFNGNCMEVAPGVLVRDTKDDGAGPVLRFSAPAWGEFITGIKGEGNGS